MACWTSMHSPSVISVSTFCWISPATSQTYISSNFKSPPMPHVASRRFRRGIYKHMCHKECVSRGPTLCSMVPATLGPQHPPLRYHQRMGRPERRAPRTHHSWRSLPGSGLRAMVSGHLRSGHASARLDGACRQQHLPHFQRLPLPVGSLNPRPHCLHLCIQTRSWLHLSGICLQSHPTESGIAGACCS